MAEQYVVIEYNQASGQPRLVGDDVYSSFEDAKRDVQRQVEETRRVGRRERYAVASLDIEWDSSER